MPFHFFKHHQKTNEITSTSEITYVIREQDDLEESKILKKFTKGLMNCPENFTLSSRRPASISDDPIVPIRMQSDMLDDLKHRYVAVFQMSSAELKKLLLKSDFGKHFALHKNIKSNLKLLEKNLLNVQCEVFNPDKHNWIRIKDYTLNQLKHAEHKEMRSDVLHGLALALGG